MTPPAEPKPYRRPSELAGWPIAMREVWGRLSERLELDGVPWPESERRAFAEVNAELGQTER